MALMHFIYFLRQGYLIQKAIRGGVGFTEDCGCEGGP